MGYFFQPSPIESTPPLRAWSMINLPWNGSVTEVRRVRMPNLIEFYCESSPVTDLPWDDLVNINYFGAYNSQFTELPLWRLPNLWGCWASYSSNLTTVDAHDLQNLSDLGMDSCSSLTSIDISGCPNLGYVYFAYGSLPQAVVDQVLADLVANGREGGYAELSGNAAPSSTGQSNKAILASRGWSVYTN